MTMSNNSAIGVFIGRPGRYLRTIGWTAAAGEINRGGSRTVRSAPHRQDENACPDQQDPGPVARRRALAEEGEGELSYGCLGASQPTSPSTLDPLLAPLWR